MHHASNSPPATDGGLLPLDPALKRRMGVDHAGEWTIPTEDAQAATRAELDRKHQEAMRRMHEDDVQSSFIDGYAYAQQHGRTDTAYWLLAGGLLGAFGMWLLARSEIFATAMACTS